MILVDSSVWIDFFNGVDSPPADKLNELLGNEMIVTGDLIMVEVLQGFHNDTHFQKARNIFLELPFFNLCNKDLSMIAAENYRMLRKKGITVRKTIDVIIATFCLENRIHLLHHDRDFHPLEAYLGLQVISC
ncbi:type II toxin-antitoxin system VapC family toxin [Pleomorphovibrio marinus]|uniref:type II toxin-antitoxin system VapC family toxin n=1 Tax=Pleomorphovibrio marinus TaxID=2164132 RepID=UPI000E0BD218|nr:PIN domain nuclease [Pleomorphovibrio marinus]